MAFETPVLLLVFNRPDTTRKVFSAIRKARPTRLYVAADGKRAGYPPEEARCEEVRAIATAADWPCEISTLLRDRNLGCKRAVSDAITWFFERESEGIILEDDCVPNASFFGYCAELLERYRDDERVWQICGTALLEDAMDREDPASYVFSKYGPVWGWASWRRAWRQCDVDLRGWPVMRRPRMLRAAYDSAKEQKLRRMLGDRLSGNGVDTWDYQWGMAKNYQSGLSIVPKRNLVVNIGFASDATHTRTADSRIPKSASEMDLPLTHPRYVLADRDHDRAYVDRIFRSGSIGLFGRIAGHAARGLNRALRIK